MVDGPTLTAEQRLRAWIDAGPTGSSRAGAPIYKSPGEIKADVAALLARTEATEKALAALEYAAGRVCDEYFNAGGPELDSAIEFMDTLLPDPDGSSPAAEAEMWTCDLCETVNRHAGRLCVHCCSSPFGRAGGVSGSSEAMCDYCGRLVGTRPHKHACPHRTTTFCQSHPTGCGPGSSDTSKTPPRATDGATADAVAGELPLTFGRLQSEQVAWVEHNFGGRPSHVPLLGALEELGELAHAHIKGEQGIRHTPEEIAAMKHDAIGDIIIYLSDYCTAEFIDFQQAVEETWAQVSKRDWKADPANGSTAHTEPGYRATPPDAGRVAPTKEETGT